MAVKLFLLGRPGSGKSTVRRYVTKIAQHQFLSPYPITDYKILRNMCMADLSHTRICSTEFGGFEVLDFSVLDTALHIIERRVEKALKRHPLALPRIAIIEFARSDYLQALSQFDPDFLKDAHFLILESDVDTCLDRIDRRIRCCEFDDDTFVPVNIMENYYQKDSTLDSIHKLQEAFGLNDHQIQLMKTDGPCDEFLHDCIRVYFQSLIEPAILTRRFVRISKRSQTSNIEIFSNHCPSPLQKIQMPYQILHNGTEQKSSEAKPIVVLTSSDCTPLHKNRRTIEIEISREEEVNEQLDAIRERKLVGTASS